MAEDVRLTKIEKNSVFELLQAGGLNLPEFRWNERRYDEPIAMHGMTYSKASSLIHDASEYFYTFGKYRDECSPGSYERIERTEIFDGGAEQRWRYRIPVLQQWVRNIKDELEAPDLWGQLLQQKSLAIATSLTPADDQFTIVERKECAEAFKRIEGRITDLHQLTSAQSEALHDGLEEIKREMNRFGKKDWVNYATGLLFNIMVGAAFAPSAAKDIYHMFSAAVVSILDVAHRLIQ